MYIIGWELLIKRENTNHKRSETAVAPELPCMASPNQQELVLEVFMPVTGRKIYRVPQELRTGEKNIYDPVVLALGPFQDHGQPRFARLEEVKKEILMKMFDTNGSPSNSTTTSASEFVKNLSFYDWFLEQMDDIRSCYVGIASKWSDDNKLAEMMLLDTCFLVHIIEIFGQNDVEQVRQMVYRLGWSTVLFVLRDLLMLENQIPLWVVRCLLHIHLITTSGPSVSSSDSDMVLCKYLIFESFGLFGHEFNVPQKVLERHPLHLLEASSKCFLVDQTTTDDARGSNLPRPSNLETIKKKARKILHYVSARHPQEGDNGSRRGVGQEQTISSRASMLEAESLPFRSVTELKAKGIEFKPSSNRLTDIRFDSGLLSGRLHLPIRKMNNHTKLFFSNVIAFEMSPDRTNTNFEIISYINFMKSLIDNPADVKELRQQGILFSILGNDAEVVALFKSIETYGFNNYSIFHDVKERVEAHCNSKAKTWMAELMHTYFRSPWTAIALFAATLILCLTFIQAYYAVHPKK